MSILVKIEKISSKISQQNVLINTALLIGFLVFLAILFLRVQHISVHTVDLIGFEQDEIYTLQQVLSGKPIYNSPEEPPFSITQKTPIYHIITGGIGKVAQIDPSDPYNVYLLNRVTSLIFALMTCLVGFLLIYRIFGASLKLSMILGMLMFIAMEGHMFTRPDSLFSLTFLLTIGCNILYVLYRKNHFLWISIILGVLTIFVKQTGMILPVITLSYILFFEKDWRKLLSGSVIFLLTFVLLLFFLSNGNISTFLANTIGGLNNGIDARWFYDFIYKFTYQKFALFFIFGIYCCWEWMSKKRNNPVTNFLSLALALDFVFTHFISLKWGATPSYFSEFVHLSILAVPVYYKTIQHTSFMPFISKFSFLAFLVSIPLLTSGKRLINSINQSDQAHFVSCERMQNYLEENYPEQMKEWLLTDDELLKLYLHQNAILPQEDISHRAFVTKQFDYSKYFEYIQTGKIPLLISKNSLSELEQNEWYLFSEFSDYYKKVESVEGFHIYQFERQLNH